MLILMYMYIQCIWEGRGEGWVVVYPTISVCMYMCVLESLTKYMYMNIRMCVHSLRNAPPIDNTDSRTYAHAYGEGGWEVGVCLYLFK